jgi:hypothetical protein
MQTTKPSERHRQTAPETSNPEIMPVYLPAKAIRIVNSDFEEYAGLSGSDNEQGRRNKESVSRTFCSAVSCLVCTSGRDLQSSVISFNQTPSKMTSSTTVAPSAVGHLSCRYLAKSLLNRISIGPSGLVCLQIHLDLLVTRRQSYHSL